MSLKKSKAKAETTEVVPVISDEKLKELAKALDTIIKLKGVAEAVDGFIIKGVLVFVNEKAAPFIGPALREAINGAIDGFLANDVSAVFSYAPKVINEFVNLPQLDDDVEAKFYAINTQALFQFIMYYVGKKKKADEAAKEATE